MGSINKVVIMGNLTKDIEMRYSDGGMAIGGTSIALNRKYKDGKGKSKEETSFIDVTFFGKTAEIAEQYLRKGDQACIAGRLKQDSWEKNGKRNSKVLVICEELSFVGGGGGGGGKSRRRDDDDDDDDRGGNRRRKDDDDDEEDRGSSRSRSRKDDDDDDDRSSRREGRSKRDREDD